MPGPAPKPAKNRARRNTPATEVPIPIPVDVMPQPDLPKSRVAVCFDPISKRQIPKRRAWPKATREWWENWGKQPIAAKLTALDWDFLAETALLHAAIWHDGQFNLMAEYRQRVAAFGVTPKSRDNLRRYLTDETAEGADDANDAIGNGQKSARERLAPLVLLPTGTG
jgi:hypothetical protein